MESRAKLFGHAIHPILIVYPLAFLATALGYALMRRANTNDRAETTQPKEL
jgi:uncharacterized membrane protein